MIQKTSVVGLGKLGACMAACFAAKGFPTIGVDLNARAVDAFNSGLAPVDETNLQATIAKGKGRLSAVRDYLPAVLGSDVTFVIVPTPSEPHGGFSLKYAKAAFREIGKALAKKDGYHLVVLTSTVLPGATQYALLPVLEEASGKRCGKDFGLCYSPEFIALGSVIRDFLNPDFVLVGESDEKSGALLASFYGRVCDNAAPVARMSIINAELTKMSVNSFMTMKISFANMLASLCEKLPGGDVDVVTQALSLFGGVGKKALRGGLGYGGPCLPRDNVALSYLAKGLGDDVGVPAAVDQFNRSLVGRLADIVLCETRKGSRAAVLGLSYKPATWVTEESQGLELAKILSTNGLDVVVYDPKAMDSARSLLPARVAFAASVEQAVREADTIVLTTPDPAFAEIPMLLGARAGEVTIIDAWRLLRKELSGKPGVKYVPLGVGVRAGGEAAQNLKQLSETT